MAFKFSLAAVLRIRIIIEEREENILQKILYEISQTNLRLERIDTDLGGSDASRLADLFKQRIGGHLHFSDGEVQGLQQSRKDVHLQLDKLEQLRDQQLKIYEAARRNREMLTDMREEKNEAYDSDLARREQKTLDDNYIARRGRH